MDRPPPAQALLSSYRGLTRFQGSSRREAGEQASGSGDPTQGGGIDCIARGLWVEDPTAGGSKAANRRPGRPQGIRRRRRRVGYPAGSPGDTAARFKPRAPGPPSRDRGLEASSHRLGAAAGRDGRSPLGDGATRLAGLMVACRDLGIHELEAGAYGGGRRPREGARMPTAQGGGDEEIDHHGGGRLGSWRRDDDRAGAPGTGFEASTSPG